MFIILQVGAPSRLLPPPPRVWPHPIFTLYTIYVQLIGIPPGWGYGHMLLQKIAAESNTLSYGAINLMFNYLSFVFLCIFSSVLSPFRLKNYIFKYVITLQLLLKRFNFESRAFKPSLKYESQSWFESQYFDLFDFTLGGPEGKSN